MTEFEKILRQFEALLTDNDFQIINNFQKGLEDSKSNLHDFFSTLKLPMRNDLVELYGWKNGVTGIYDSKIENLELFPNGIMLPLDYAISHYVSAATTYKKANKKFFPLFTSGGGDFILINLDEKSQSYGQLYLFSPSILQTDKPVSIYDSLSSLFITLKELFKAKGYIYNSNNCLEVDFELEEDISGKLNPKSKFWE